MNPGVTTVTSDHGSSKKPFPHRSTSLTLSGGGISITKADIINMNQYLLPRLPVDLRVIAANMINFDWSSLSHGTVWFFKKDDQGRITAAVLNDLRDHYTRLFCELDYCAELLEEALDWQSEAIYFGAAYEPQIPFIEASMRQHGFHSKGGFDTYPSITLVDYKKFEEAQKMQKTLPDGFVSDSLKWPSDSDYVNSTWTYTNATSYITVGESVYSRPSICIRDPSKVGLTSDPTFTLTNHLVGWEITRSDYSLGSLKVLEPYRMKGFGKWLSTELTSKIISVAPIPEIAHAAIYPNPQPIAFVDQDNIASIKLHQGLGFELGTRFGWTGFNRADVNHILTLS